MLNELKSLIQGKADHLYPMAIRAANKARTRRSKKPWNPVIAPKIPATAKKSTVPITFTSQNTYSTSVAK